MSVKVIGETTTCKVIKITTGIKVEASPPSYIERSIRYSHEYGSEKFYESLKKKLEAWACELHDFLRDHRSQDLVSIDIVRETGMVCSACKSEWEPCYEDGVTFCAGCGATLEGGGKE